MDIKERNSIISGGRNSVQQKIKEIRRNFRKAAVSDSRSGSGNIVFAQARQPKIDQASPARRDHIIKVIECLGKSNTRTNTKNLKTNQSQKTIKYIANK